MLTPTIYEISLLIANATPVVPTDEPEGGITGAAQRLFEIAKKESWEMSNRPRAVSQAIDCAAMMTKAVGFIHCCTQARLAHFADSMGLTVASLNRLKVGWSPEHNAYSFPMENAEGDVVGIRLRKENGLKLSVAGGHQGLHVPKTLGKPRGIVLTEGATDCAAMLDLGLPAVGRPSCSGGLKLSTELIKKIQPECVVILADNDEMKRDGRRPGIEGAEALASVLALHAKVVKIIVPAEGIKDARDWKISGATAVDVKAAIKAATAFKVSLKAITLTTEVSP